VSALRRFLMSSTVLQSPGFGFRPKLIVKEPIAKEPVAPVTATPTTTTETASRDLVSSPFNGTTLRRRPARGLRP